MTLSRLAAVPALIILVVPVGPSLADEPPMSANFVISALDNIQWEPDVAYAFDFGVYLAVWRDNELGTGIYGQLLNRDGGHVGSRITISTCTNPCREPRVAYDWIGNNFFVVWMQDTDSTSGFDWELYGEWILPWESPSPPSNIQLTNWAGDIWHPSVAFAAAQGPPQEFLIVCTHHSGGTPYIAALRVCADNSCHTPVGAISTGPEVRDFPDITYNLARNEFLVTYQMNNATDVDVYGVRLRGDGVVLGTGAFPIATTGYDDISPAVAACQATDQYLAVWESMSGFPSYKPVIAGCFVAGDGTPDCSLPMYFDSPATAAGEVGWPEVTCNNSVPEFLVAWEVQDYSVANVYGIRVNTPFGFVSWPVFPIAEEFPPAHRVKPAGTSGYGKGYLVASEHVRYQTSYRDIRGRILLPLTVFSDGFESGNVGQWSNWVL